MAHVDLTSAIEQMEMMEEKLGITFGGLSAFLDHDEDDDWEPTLTVTGEIISTSGDPLEEDIEIKIAAYDSQGRVVAKASEYIDEESFAGFDVFDVSLETPVADIVKIRIFPVK